MWEYDLSTAVKGQNCLEQKVTHLPYDLTALPFGPELNRFLHQQLDIPLGIELAKVHEHVAPEFLADIFANSKHWYYRVSQLGQELERLFLQLVANISDAIGVDFVFEQDPVLRFHLPRKMDDRFRLPDGQLFTLHSDTMLGDYFEQVQAWLPLSDVSGPGALAFVDQKTSVDVLSTYVESLNFDVKRYADGRDHFFEYMKNNPALAKRCLTATQPMAVDYGNCLLFCPTVLHGTAENSSDRTRISIDFRLLPVDVYDKVMANYTQPSDIPVNEDDKVMCRGDYYHSLTTQQLKAQLKQDPNF